MTLFPILLMFDMYFTQIIYSKLMEVMRAP